MPTRRANRSPFLRRHLGLGLLLFGLVTWPVVHRAPASACPPGADSCPLDNAAGGTD